jgi:hypothetical protein
MPEGKSAGIAHLTSRLTGIDGALSIAALALTAM